VIYEVDRVNEILDGKNINPYEMRSICRLLTRYYYDLGITDQKEIRKNIFSWANKYKLYIKLSVKHLIAEELSIYRPINKDRSVRVSQGEIDAIKLLSKKRTVRRAMLGILCYAKVFAINNIIDINIKDFSNWIGYSSVSNFYNFALKEMLKINFIRDEEDYIKWQNGHITKCTRKLYVNFDVSNREGEYVLFDNNFQKLYDNIKW
jgi:hypothetical protein